MTYETRKTDLAFKVDDGTVLRGWHVEPERTDGSRVPVIVLHHGFSAVKESFLEDYARVFARAGFSVLGYDPRGLGESGGRIRLEIDPHQQVADFRDAITFAMTLPGVDPERIGAWGSSYGGGVAIQASALDKRVTCLAVQVPFLSGGGIWSHIPAEARAQLSALFRRERAERAAGRPIQTVPVVTPDPESGELCILATRESYEWAMKTATQAANWRNEVTVRSLELTFSFEPASFLRYLDSRPLMFIGAAGDTLMPIDLSRALFEAVAGPKEFVTLPCGHFGPYDACFEQSSAAACDWFLRHMAP